MPDFDDIIGKRIGKCLISKRLSNGGFGYSFIGFDDEIKKERVVKISRITLDGGVGDIDALENFKREGIILARLNHPQIVSLIEQGEAFGYRYMIIDYIKGFDFTKVLSILKKRRKKLGCSWQSIIDPASAFAIVLSALSPLAYSHKVKIELPGQKVVKGLAHRDISTGNLIIGHGHEQEGYVHLIDFGIAKTNINISSTINANLIGSPIYMSPMRLKAMSRHKPEEIYWNTFQQTKHDIHSIGCFLYELLTGVPHIQTTDVASCVAQIQSPDTYKDLQETLKVRGFSRDIRDVISKSIVFPDFKKKNTPYQYSDAGEMIQDVQAIYEELAGDVPVKDLLIKLSSEIDNPGIITADSGTTRIGALSKTGKYKTGFSGKHKSTRIYLLSGAFIVAALIYAVYVLYIQLSARASVKSDYREIHTDSSYLKSTVTSAPVPMGASVKNSTNKNMDSSSIRLVYDSKRDKSSLKSKVSSKTRTIKPVTPRAAAPHKPITTAFNEVQQLIKAGNTMEAYKKVNAAIAAYDDAAFYVIQAGLLKRRNPNSNKVTELLNSARQKKSRIWTKEELLSKISDLELL